MGKLPTRREAAIIHKRRSRRTRVATATQPLQQRISPQPAPVSSALPHLLDLHHSYPRHLAPSMSLHLHQDRGRCGSKMLGLHLETLGMTMMQRRCRQNMGSCLEIVDQRALANSMGDKYRVVPLLHFRLQRRIQKAPLTEAISRTHDFSSKGTCNFTKFVITDSP